jgi:hypothetical protein
MLSTKQMMEGDNAKKEKMWMSVSMLKEKSWILIEFPECSSLHANAQRQRHKNILKYVYIFISMELYKLKWNNKEKSSTKTWKLWKKTLKGIWFCFVTLWLSLVNYMIKDTHSC